MSRTLPSAREALVSAITRDTPGTDLPRYVAVLDAPYSDTMGHAGAVVLHPDGTLEGVHDPRADGGAVGL